MAPVHPAAAWAPTIAAGAGLPDMAALASGHRRPGTPAPYTA
ncbi:hypothetical protein [Streptomyces sioyaensis]